MKKSNWHGGKGSGRRSSQDDNKYADNWEKIFGKHKKADQDYTEQLKKNSIETADKKIYKDSK
jgi:N-methylhydantoinase B/oxoprolinase/acetone carboxylase alpha subunit